MIEEYANYSADQDWQILKNGTQIHKTALVAPWVWFDDNCIVNPYAVVGRMPNHNSALVRTPHAPRILKFGRNTIIGCHAIIFGDVVVRDNCFIGDYASIREGCRIGNMCVIGRQVTLNYNVKIGDRSRFQDGTHITGDCIIGSDCFFGVGVITSNDRRVDLDHYHFPNPSQPPIFGNKILVGSGANILAGCKIGDNVIIGAGALITKNVEKDCVMLGKSAEVKEKKEDICDAQLIFDNLTNDFPKDVRINSSLPKVTFHHSV